MSPRPLGAASRRSFGENIRRAKAMGLTPAQVVAGDAWWSARWRWVERARNTYRSGKVRGGGIGGRALLFLAYIGRAVDEVHRRRTTVTDRELVNTGRTMIGGYRIIADRLELACGHHAEVPPNTVKVGAEFLCGDWDHVKTLDPGA